MKDFNLLFLGYQTRQEKEWNRTRHLMQYIRVFSGMGASEVVTVQEIWPLSMDKQFEKRYITSLELAKGLMKEFEEAYANDRSN